MEPNKELGSSTQVITREPSLHNPSADDLEKQTTGSNLESIPNSGGNPTTAANIVDWDGPDDPENPMNWSTKKKTAAIAVVSSITMLSPLASTIISSSTGDVMKTFHSDSQTLAALVTSVYLLGYVFGPMVIAPMSEIYGRAIVYNVCNFIFLVFNIACAVAPSLNSLIVFRMFAGIAASCPITIGFGTVADIIPREKRGAVTGLVFIGPLLGPTVGPLVGAYLAAAKSWRWVFWLVSMLAGVSFILTIVFTPETYAYVILDRKTKRMRKLTGNENLQSALSLGRTPKEHFKMSIVRPLKMLFLSPIVFLFSLYAAVVYGYLYLLFVTFDRVYQGQYGFSTKGVGLTYLGVGVGSFIGLIFCSAVSDRTVTYLTKRNGGLPKPEYRLPPLFIAAFMIPFGLFLYGWSAQEHWHWMVPIVGSAFLGGGLFFCFMPIGVYLIDTFTTYAASATAANTILRSLLGALLPLAGNSMYDALGIGWGTSLLGFIAVAFIPVPFVFFFYGERIRRLTRVEF